MSGSGKSSLVNEILYKRLAADLNRAKTRPGKHAGIGGGEFLDKVIDIDQSPIGRTPRSNPATYTGLFNDIRELFASTQDAKARGYGQGGSPSTCRGPVRGLLGDGLIKIEMHFLPDIYVPCEGGLQGQAGTNRETLEVKYKGKNIHEVLEMTVEEALGFFENLPRLYNKIQTLYEVGLGYVKLGQPSTTLSGGEAQRRQTGHRACQTFHREDHLYPGRAHHGPPHRRCAQAHRGAPSWWMWATYGGGHRAQPGRDQDGRPCDRPGARGRRRRRNLSL